MQVIQQRDPGYMHGLRQADRGDGSWWAHKLGTTECKNQGGPGEWQVDNAGYGAQRQLWRPGASLFLNLYGDRKVWLL